MDLIKISKEKAMAAAVRAHERIRQKLPTSPMKPLQVETKRGPLNPERRQQHEHITTGKEIVPVFTKSWLSVSPTAGVASPRRRFSGSPSPKLQRHWQVVLHGHGCGYRYPTRVRCPIRQTLKKIRRIYLIIYKIYYK